MEKLEFATKARRIVLCMMLMGLLCFVTACGSSDADRMEGTTAGTPSTESTAARETKETDGDRRIFSPDKADYINEITREMAYIHGKSISKMLQREG